ncbi:uncharacterized protein LACBIDRAFT_299727 [Laccaria bicolor S238N-H82]|uniref:Predicted protein n=1 Tax=Laccaria bicolor (strain S238N-H82 / ATCC MYA-4686) TaxID=486041 RepID=B0DFA5_LACBS|nr:uncharacterized protein LACBIDRAFT_299727 [Laccaria bicolor S238N-H82]EDR06826.1 predicted protein [Laccaria bicolor S238N-H82]|eukprot:XP_001882673.1 predicted protein [Laccaria bicolor S238N-H82]
MGVPGLSEILEPARREQTLTKFALTEGFQLNPHGDNMVRVGVDVSVWICQAQAAAHSQTGENPGLRTIFYRICHLLANSILPVFVEDGPGRPRVKRGVNVKADKPHWMEHYVEDFAREAGCPIYRAPAEAEAELAQLTAHGLIEAVLTTDFDVFLFGGTCMIKPPNIKADGDKIIYYNSTDIQDLASLTRAKLIFIAILSGGDYDQIGLPGCGSKIAYQLAQGGLADSLFEAATKLAQDELQDFLNDWRNKLANELLYDPHGVMGMKHPALAQNIPLDFPKLDILRLYTHPLTSWSEHGNGPDTTSWGLHQLNLAKLAVLCEKSFSWGSAGVIVPRFCMNVWPAAVMRMLLNPIDTPGSVDRHLTRSSLFRIAREKIGPGGPNSGATVPGFSVETATLALIRETVSNLNEDIRRKALQQQRPPQYFWIPLTILKARVPNLLNEYNARTRKKKSKPNRPRRIYTDSDEGVVMSMAPDAGALSTRANPATAPNSAALASHMGPLAQDDEQVMSPMPVVSSSHADPPPLAGSSQNPLVVDEGDSAHTHEYNQARHGLKRKRVMLDFIDLT